MAGMLLLPIFGMIFVLVVALLAAAFRFRLDPSQRRLSVVACRPETWTLQLWVLMILYPTLAKTALMPFDCVDVAEESLLRASPSVTCYVPSWNALAILGGLGTAVYSFGFPLLCYLLSRAAHRAAAAHAAHAAPTEGGRGSAAARTAKTAAQGAAERMKAEREARQAEMLRFREERRQGRPEHPTLAHMDNMDRREVEREMAEMQREARASEAES